MAAAVVVMTVALARLRVIVVPALAALFASALLVPPARVLRRRGVPGSLAALAVLLGAILLVAGTIVLVAPLVGNEVGNVAFGVRQGLREIGTLLTGPPIGLSQARLDGAVDRILDELSPGGGALGSRLVSGAMLAAEVGAGLVLTLVLVFFFVRDGERMWRWIAGVFPDQRRQRQVMEIGERGWETLRTYLQGIAIVAVFDTSLIGLTLVLAGVPLVAPLMTLTFVGAFFPVVGATVAGLVASLVALVAKGPLVALIVLGAVILVQQIEGNVLYPIVVGRRVNLHPVAVLAAFTVGVTVAGLLGALVAVPVAAVIGTFISSTEVGVDSEEVAP